MLKDDLINIFGIIYLYTMGFVNTTKPNASENYPTFFMTSISVVVSMKTQSLLMSHSSIDIDGNIALRVMHNYMH